MKSWTCSMSVEKKSGSLEGIPDEDFCHIASQRSSWETSALSARWKVHTVANPSPPTLWRTNSCLSQEPHSLEGQIEFAENEFLAGVSPATCPWSSSGRVTRLPETNILRVGGLHYRTCSSLHQLPRGPRLHGGGNPKRSAVLATDPPPPHLLPMKTRVWRSTFAAPGSSFRRRINDANENGEWSARHTAPPSGHFELFNKRKGRKKEHVQENRRCSCDIQHENSEAGRENHGEAERYTTPMNHVSDAHSAKLVQNSPGLSLTVGRKPVRRRHELFHRLGLHGVSGMLRYSGGRGVMCKEPALSHSCL